MKRIVVFMLALVMLFSVFACTKNEGKKPADTTAPGTTSPDSVTTNPGTTEPTTTDFEIIVDNEDPELPHMTFNGKKYRMSHSYENGNLEVFADESSTNIRDQGIWQRNAYVEDTHEVVIEPILTGDGSFRGHITYMIEWILSGDDLYDIGLSFVHTSSPLFTSNYVKNWNNFLYTDLSKKYWMNDINDAFSIDGVIFTAVGEMCITVLTNTNVMFYNRTKGDEIMMDDQVTTMTEEIFEKIDNMEWTLDYFTALVGNIYQDVDYETGRSEGDFYGFYSAPYTSIDNWQFATDIPMVEQDDTSILELTFYNEKAAALVDKLMDFYWESNGTYTFSVADNEQLSAEEVLAKARKSFANGKALFTPDTLGTCLNEFRNMEDNYTLLPFPMWDDTQEKYLTGSMDHYSVLTVPKTCRDDNMVSYITEIMNYKSREILFPIYYEETFQKQFSRDLESIEMLNLIMDGRWFDLGTMLHESLGATAMVVRGCVQEQKDFKANSGGQMMAKANLKFLVKKFQESKNH